MRRMRVKQANPEIAFERIQFAQQRANGRGIGGQRFGGGGKFLRRRNGAAVVRAQIESVISRVLRNQIDFLHAVGDERFRLGNNVLLRAAAVRAAHPRNDAEAARMIAALGDFQIGKMFRREAKTRRLEIGNENRARGDVQNWRLRIADCGLRSNDGFGFAKFFRAANFFRFFMFRSCAVFFQFVQP